MSTITTSINSLVIWMCARTSTIADMDVLQAEAEAIRFGVNYVDIYIWPPVPSDDAMMKL